ncbi:MAG TPA: hypothetical protein VK837_05585 [Longimicrobiales bacterium]|nr:hypothetical protein [Longimicrobiales bacterium]
MPNIASRRRPGAALAALLFLASPLVAQAPADTLRAQAPPSDSASGQGLLADNGRGGDLPAEYDPGADHHFILPTGRVAPQGSGTFGAAALAYPALAAPFVAGSPAPRVSMMAGTMLSQGGITPVVGALTVQPVRYGRWDGSLTAVGFTDLDDPDIHLLAMFGTLSYGTDVYRITGATGSLGPGDWGTGFAALGFDVEVARGEGRTQLVGGEARTVRERLKFVGELYTPLESFEGAAGLVGVRYSAPGHWLNVGLPVAIGTGGGGVWLPVVSFGVTF